MSQRGKGKLTYCLLATMQVRLDLASELSSRPPPKLAPFIQHVSIRVTSYAHLKRLSAKLSELRPDVEFALDICFDQRADSGNLNLGTVSHTLRRQCLVERHTALSICCKTLIGTYNISGSEVPVSVHLRQQRPYAYLVNLMSYNLVHLLLSELGDVGGVLRALGYALQRSTKTCQSLVSLQLDCSWTVSSFYHVPAVIYPLRMADVLRFLRDIELSHLTHLGFLGGVDGLFFPVDVPWPETDRLPALQSFCGPNTPNEIFGPNASGVHLSFDNAEDFSQARLATVSTFACSALGAALYELHVVFGFVGPYLSVALNVLTQLPNLRRLRIKGVCLPVPVQAADINSLTKLEVLALDNVRIEGKLRGPCLKEIVCLGADIELLEILARPPAVLKSVTVIEPSLIFGLLEDPWPYLGMSVPTFKKASRTCIAGHWWSTTCETHGRERWFNKYVKSIVVKAVR